MAKGDDSRARNQITAQGGQSQNTLNNLSGELYPQRHQMWNNYMDATAADKQQFADTNAGYQNFAKTGGFSPQDIASIRARAIAPTRSIYANAEQGLERQRALQGGYSPGFNTAILRNARQVNQGISDADISANAGIAQMVQQGKLSGLAGMAGLYGATPGRSNLFGNQALQAGQQLLTQQQLQQQLSDAIMKNQIDASRIPGQWENTMGRINDVVGLAHNIAGAFTGLPGGFKPAATNSGRIPQGADIYGYA